MNCHRKSFSCFRWALRFGFALALTAPIAAAEAAECAVSFGYGQWPPFQSTDSSGEAVGLDVELVRTIAKKADCRATFIDAPFKRILRDVREGDLDAMVGYFKEARAEFGRYTSQYRADTKALYVRLGLDPNIRDLESFLEAGYHLGIVRSIFYGDDAMRLIENPAFADQIEVITENPLNLRKLLAGRLDGSIVNPPHVASFLREKNAVGKIDRRGNVFQTKMHMIFSKASVTESVVATFERAVEELSRDGTLAAIVRKYEE